MRRGDSRDRGSRAGGAPGSGPAALLAREKRGRKVPYSIRCNCDGVVEETLRASASVQDPTSAKDRDRRLDVSVSTPSRAVLLALLARTPNTGLSSRTYERVLSPCRSLPAAHSTLKASRRDR